jgi:uncharacterized caspase-like protein
VAAGGCSSVEPAPTTDQVVAAALEEHAPKKPLKERLAIAPVRLDLHTRVGEAKGGAPAGQGGPATSTPSSAAPAPSGKHGAFIRRARRPEGGEYAVVIRTRRPLFREILFSPQDPADAGATAPAAAPDQAAPAAPDAARAPTPAADEATHVQWICPRCQNDVTETDSSCPTCFLPFQPETPGTSPATPPPGPGPDVVARTPGTPGETAKPPEGGTPGEATRPGGEVVFTPGSPGEGKPSAEQPKPPAPPEGAKPGETAQKAPATEPPSGDEEGEETAEPKPKPGEKFVCFFCGHEVSPTAETCPTCGLALQIPPGYESLAGGQPVNVGVSEMIPTDSTHVTFQPNKVDIQNQLVSTVKAYKLFGDVRAIRATEIEEDTNELLNLAESEEDDYLLIPTVTRWEVSYQGITWRYFPAFLLAVAAEVPSWWVAAEDYQCDIEMKVDLYHVRARRKIPNWQTTYHGTKTIHADQFDRGWYTSLSLIGVPLFKYIFDNGWKNLNEVTSPHALAAVKKELIEEGLYNTFVKNEMPDFAPRSRENVALLVGVDMFTNRSIRSLHYPTADVDLMENTLSNLSGFKKITRMEPRAPQEKNVATAANIRTWLRDELPRLGRLDFVVLYFAGYGAAAKVPVDPKHQDGYEKYFVPFDADPANLAGTAIKLTEIEDALREAKVQRALVIFDCSFGGGVTDESIGQGRTLKPLDDPAVLTTSFLDDMSNRGGGRKCVVLTACAPGEAALESGYLPSGGNGAFTYYFAEGIQGAADEVGNRDGQVDLEEAINYAKERVRALGIKTGQPMEVQAFGEIGKMPIVLKKAGPKTIETGSTPK